MSITKIHSVFCDFDSPECHGWIAEAHTTTEARRIARNAGWRRVALPDGGTGDKCPGCLTGVRRPGPVF